MHFCLLHLLKPSQSYFLDRKLAVRTPNAVMDMELAAKNLFMTHFLTQVSNPVFTTFAKVIGENSRTWSNNWICQQSWIRTILQKIFCISVLPLYHIEKAFDVLYEEKADDERFEGFILYFENNYIGRPNQHGIRRRPRYEIKN